MKKTLCILCCLLTLSVTGGCVIGTTVANSSTPPEGAYRLYYAVHDPGTGGAAVDYEYWTPEANVELARTLFATLLAGPKNEDLFSPFPAGVSLRRAVLEGGTLRLDLSEQYSALSGIDLTIANYCLTLTLCQIEGVESVHVTVEGRELPYFAARELRSGDVVLTGDEEKPVYVDATLWFARTGGEGLGVELRQVLKTEDDTSPKAVLDALLAGPSEGQERLAPLLPPETQLNSVLVEDAVCTVDFNSAFLAETGAEQARLRLYSVVNTLASSLETIQAVQILVDGIPVSQIGGIPTTAPLEPDYSLERFGTPVEIPGE